MVENGDREHGTTLRDYLRVVRRRKWVIVMAVVLVPAAAVAFSLQQQRLYSASADVLLVQQNLGTQLNGLTDPTVYQQPDRKAQTQADIARSPEVARRALEAAGMDDRSAENLLAHSSVSAKQNADLLHFSVTDRDPAIAANLANEYGKAFIGYRAELDTAVLLQARGDVDARLKALRRGSAAYEALVEKGNTVDTMIALASKPAVLVNPARDAAQVQPRPVRNGVLAGVLGIVLGIGLAFLWEALDTRVRSAEEVGERLGLPLLARLPEPPRKLRTHDELVMVAEPDSVGGEAFRTMRTNLDFVALNGASQTIMVTSAIQAEGKSTTIANLAVAYARAGKRVVLVDLDLRRPYIDRFFPFEERPGLTEVALGYAYLDEAILSVGFTSLPTFGGARRVRPALRPLEPTENGNGRPRERPRERRGRPRRDLGRADSTERRRLRRQRATRRDPRSAPRSVRARPDRCAAAPSRRRRHRAERARRRDDRRHAAEHPAPAHAERAEAGTRRGAGEAARLRRQRSASRRRLYLRRLLPLRTPLERPPRAGEGRAVTRTRILVADPRTIFRCAVSSLLARESDLQVVEAADFDEVAEHVSAGCPDIALIDLELPPSGGVEAVKLLSKFCSAHMIVWSFAPTREAVLAAVRAGADGYLHKEISPLGLVRSIRGVLNGEAPLSRDLATLMIDAIHGLEERDRTRERLSVLSLREREILGQVALGAA